MRRPHLSTGAWIFSGIIGAAIIAPVGVYAATSQTVSIGNIGASTTTATVTTQHQLLTAAIAPNNVVTFGGENDTSGCQIVYTPPAGKAFVLTQVTYDIGSGTAGTEAYASVAPTCANQAVDEVDTTDAYHSESHSFPTGVPMSHVALSSTADQPFQIVTGVGYLIPSALLPATAVHTVNPQKVMNHKSAPQH